VLRVANVIPQSSSLGPAGAPTSGPFGQGRLILDGSSIRATTAGDITIGNELVLRGDTTIPNTIGARNLLFTGPVTLESGDRTLTHQSSANTVFSGVIDDDGNDLALRIAGTGTGAVILSGANTYGGGTTIEGTSLLVTNTSGSGTGSGDVVVRNTGTLGGTGSIGAALTTVESGGRVSAGVPGVASGTGTLTFTGDLTTATGSTWLIDIVQDQNGLSDRINVGGVLDLSGASFLPNFLGSFTNGHVYTLASYGSLTGTFDGWAEGAIISNYQISYGSGTSGAITLTAVPEPGTLAILGGALGGIFWSRRRRGRRAGRPLS
jgi:autotransporter-associated beta strand protein